MADGETREGQHECVKGQRIERATVYNPERPCSKLVVFIIGVVGVE